MIVIDTNVIVHCFMRTPFTEAAQRVRVRDPNWHAPAFWRTEFRNVLCGYFRRGVCGLEDLQLVRAAAESALTGHEHVVPGERVLALAAANGISTYDAEFVTLAEELQAPLITEDKQLLKTFPQRAVSMEKFLSFDDAPSLHAAPVPYAAQARHRSVLRQAYEQLSKVHRGTNLRLS